MKDQLLPRPLFTAMVVPLLAGLVIAPNVASATDKSSSRPNVLSVPTGPGSASGLGESFEPNLNSGSARETIPVALPPGTAGLAPSLALSYDSGQGNGPLGIGWSLGLSTIQVQTEKGLPRYDGTERFLLDGAELVPLDDGYFRLKNEGRFLRARRLSNPEHWEVDSPDGRRLTYGKSGSARIEEKTSTGARVFAWALEGAVDLFGNEIAYAYEKDREQIYLKEIAYNVRPGTAQNRVVLDYQGRPDALSDYRPRFAVQTARRLQRISVFSQNRLLRRYLLAYDETSGFSMLASVTQVGADDGSALPPARFSYSKLATDRKTVAMQAPVEAVVRPGDSNAELVDIDGDGFVDLVHADVEDGHWYCLNQGGLRFGSRTDMVRPPSVSLATRGVEIADLNGDGMPDLAAKLGLTDSEWVYFPNLGRGHWEREVLFSNNPPFKLEESNVRLLDFDHDKLVDAVESNVDGRLSLWRNRGDGRWEGPIEEGLPQGLTAAGFTDPHLQLADMNGDRLLDLVYLLDGAVRYWPSLGWGQFGPPIELGNSPSVGVVAENELKLADINGDGLADVVRIATDHVDVWPLLPSGSFGTRRTIAGIPFWDSTTTAVRLADMNGNGTLDIVWMTPSAPEDGRVVYLDLVGDTRPNLLTRVENGLGKALALSYSSSGSFYQEASAAGRPWATRLPFPVPVLAGSTLTDSRGGIYETHYSYANGAYDADNREFRGFGLVDVTELGEADDPTSVVVHTYDLGLESEARKGRELAVEVRTEEGEPLGRTDHTFAVRLYAKGIDGRWVAGAELVRSEATHFEAGKPAALIREEWSYDEFGNRLTDSKWGLVVGGDPLAGNDESITTTTYLNDSAHWILGRPKETKLSDAAGRVLTWARSYYDGAEFQGLPLGQMTLGLITREERWVESQDGGERWAQLSRVSRDGYGNIVAMLSPRGARREVTFDSETHTLPQHEGLLLDGERALDFEVTYLPGRGALVDSLTDSNGATTRFTYDALDRLVAIIKPGDTDDLPTLRYLYELASPLSSVTTESRPSSGQSAVIRSFSYFDGLGRSIAEVRQAERNRWVVSHRKVYSRRGSVLAEWDPYFAPTFEIGGIDPGLGVVRHGYDALGRRSWSLFPDGLKTERHYGALWREDWDAEDLDPRSPHAMTPMRYEEDGLGRTVRIFERLGAQSLSTRFSFDAAGRRVAVTNAHGQATRYFYDGLGSLLGFEHPDAGGMSYRRDDEGNMTRWTDALGQYTDRTFDLAGRILSEDSFDSQGTAQSHIAYHYDLASPKLSSPGATAMGKLTWVEDLAGEEHFAYDTRGRMTASVRIVDGKEFRLGQDHDNLDRVIGLTYPDGVRLDYLFNERGLLSSVSHVVQAIEYDAFGLATRRIYTNGVVSMANHDVHQRLESLAATDGAGTAIQGLRFAYDKAGTLKTIEDRVHPEGKLAGARSFLYDDLYRLTSVTSPAGNASFVYDSVGNLLQKSDVGDYSYPAPGAEQPNAVQSIGGAPIQHNSNGAVTSSLGRTFEWDSRGDLRKVTAADGSVTEYRYDFEGHRVTKQVTTKEATKKVVYLDRFAEERDGEIVKYVFAGDVRLARVGGGAPRNVEVAARTFEGLRGVGAGLGAAALAFGAALLGSAGVARRRLGRRAVAAGLAVLVGCARPLSVQSPIEGTIFYVSDHLGSAEWLTDDSGKLVGESSYDAWGMQIAATDEPFAFTGKEWDAEAGLLYFGARYYDPRVGQFLTVDPAPLTGPERSMDDPQTLNPYSYARNTPTSLRDRDGKMPHILAGALAGAAVGAAVYLVKGAITKEAYTWNGVLSAVAGGAVSGAVAAATGGASIIVSGAASGAAGGIAERAVTTGSLEAAFNAKEMARDAVIGGGIGKALAVAAPLASKIVGAVKGRMGGGAVAEEIAGAACSGGRCSGPKCFVAGTLVDSAHGALPIESVALGERVGPESEECARLDFTGWKEVELEFLPRDESAAGDAASVRLLRPPAWLAEQNVELGATVELQLSELRTSGVAKVTGVREAPGLERGERCPVTGTIRHFSRDVLRVVLAGGALLGVTSQHPLFSADRNDWVRAEELEVGEWLETRTGVASVARVEGSRKGNIEVFNLEVAREHRYYVGAYRVLAHNQCLGDAAESAGKLPRFQGPKPTYHVNEAHVPGPKFNPKKEPLPADAAEVYERAVPDASEAARNWYGKNADGTIYRFSNGNDGTAHFSGSSATKDGIRNITPYARQRLEGK